VEILYGLASLHKLNVPSSRVDCSKCNCHFYANG